MGKSLKLIATEHHYNNAMNREVEKVYNWGSPSYITAERLSNEISDLISNPKGTPFVISYNNWIVRDQARSDQFFDFIVSWKGGNEVEIWYEAPDKWYAANIISIWLKSRNWQTQRYCVSKLDVDWVERQMFKPERSQ
jgi:hypothetical protein